MPSEKRQRQKEGQRARLEAARAVARRRQRRRQLVSVMTFLGIIVAIFALLAIIQGGGSSKKPETASGYGTGVCPPTTKSPNRPTGFSGAPKNCLTPGATYKAVITTNLGVMTVVLDTANAPVTVNNFVALARWGWFDGEGFHRVVKDFVDQAGDAAGRGDPGYKIPDELPSGMDAYAKGTLAMANAGPNTGGSQWFICVDCSKLPGANFPIFGQIIEGLDVVDAINTLATDKETPSSPVTISTVDIIQS